MTIDPDRPGDSSGPAGRPRLWSREFSTRAIASWVVRNRLPIAVGVGIGLRVIQYGHDRGYWLDEGSLVSSIEALNPSSMLGPLGNSQLAPPGFLLAEWSAMRCLGGSPWALRLVPLLSGIASMFLIAAVARRSLPARAVWVAVALFAVSGDLIYYASEAKQYSSDVALGLACLWLGLAVGPEPLDARRAGLLAAAGASVVWVSHPSVFVLAAVGTVGLSRAGRVRDGRSVAWWVVVGLAWVGSFAAVHAVAMDQLGHQGGMWRFWDFAFPPVPPRSVWDATWVFRRLALVFVDPLNFDAPIGPRLSMLPAIALGLAGSVRLGRVAPDRLAILMLPGVFALLAAHLRLYPFHGRLILFLVPSILLAIASGLDLVREARGRGLLFAVLATMVLGFPALTAAYHVVEPYNRNFANPYGDLRPSVLDPYRFPF